MLRNRVAWSGVVVLTLLTGLSSTVSAQRDRDRGRGRERWELLGTAHVDGAVDHDSIQVGIRDGRFRAIQLRVRGGAIEFSRVVVRYGDGEPEEITVRDRIPSGGQTRAIDLRGRERFIRSV